GSLPQRRISGLVVNVQNPAPVPMVGEIADTLGGTKDLLLRSRLDQGPGQRPQVGQQQSTPQQAWPPGAGFQPARQWPDASLPHGVAADQPEGGDEEDRHEHPVDAKANRLMQHETPHSEASRGENGKDAEDHRNPEAESPVCWGVLEKEGL